jgi:tetratricopeptide (TPR) repeat protein
VTELQPLSHYFGRQFWANPEYTEVQAYYRPLVSISFALDHALWSGDPRGFHATNVALHLICCALVFGLALRGGAPPLAAGLAALLFGLAPRLTESAAWISGRTDLMACAGALGAWLLYQSAPERTGRRIAAAFVLLLGLLGKEVALAGATAIFAMEGLRLLYREATVARVARNLAPLLVAIVGYALLRASVVEMDRLWHLDRGFPLGDRLLFFLQALGTYTVMLVDPLRPSLEIGTLGVLEPARIALGVVAAGFVGGGLVALARRRGPEIAAAAAVLAVVAIAPVLHLIALPLHALASDRFLYLPIAGLAVMLAVGARGLSRRAALAAGLVALLAVPAFAVATARRAALFSDELALWHHDIENAPPLGMGSHAALAHVYFEREDYAQALVHFEEALARRRTVMAGYPEIDVIPGGIVGNAALCRGELGDWHGALPTLARMVAERPDAPLNHFNLAMAQARVLAFDGAESSLATALRLYPDYEAAQTFERNLAVAREEWEALPPPARDESTDVRAARARVMARLGARYDARLLWGLVVAAGNARPEDVRLAALYLTFQGEPEEARSAIARLATLPERAEQARELEEALEARLARNAGLRL